MATADRLGAATSRSTPGGGSGGSGPVRHRLADRRRIGRFDEGGQIGPRTRLSNQNPTHLTGRRASRAQRRLGFGGGGAYQSRQLDRLGHPGIPPRGRRWLVRQAHLARRLRRFGIRLGLVCALLDLREAAVQLPAGELAVDHVVDVLEHVGVRRVED
jgi:hypothetical protein